MSPEERRKAILGQLRAAETPVSAASLARQYNVSRQVVVGDIALLRAGGESVYATPRGYVLDRETASLTRTVACVHTAADMERELDIMVDNGCTVRDVIVEHPIYGQLTGKLELKSRFDVSEFAVRSARSEAMPLSALTDGIHLHTLLCPDISAYERTKTALREAGFLLPEEN